MKDNSNYRSGNYWQVAGVKKRVKRTKLLDREATKSCKLGSVGQSALALSQRLSKGELPSDAIDWGTNREKDGKLVSIALVVS